MEHWLSGTVGRRVSNGLKKIGFQVYANVWEERGQVRGSNLKMFLREIDGGWIL